MDNENINNKAVKRLYELYGENPDLRIHYEHTLM